MGLPEASKNEERVGFTMAYFEDTLGMLGRRIDRLCESVRERFGGSGGGGRVAAPRISPGEWISGAKDAGAKKIDDVKRGWDLAPDDQRRRVKIGAIICLCVLAGIGSGMLAFTLSGGRGPVGNITGPEAAALKAVQDRFKEAEKGVSATGMFHGAK